MAPQRKPWQQFRQLFKDEVFLGMLGSFEGLVSKILSIAMVIVIIVSIYDLLLFVAKEIYAHPFASFGSNLFTVFGLFLNVLIALEILENITAYLKKHVLQVELVIATSLIAVSRKIIILDLQKTAGLDLIALASAILALSVSYWLTRRTHRRRAEPKKD